VFSKISIATYFSGKNRHFQMTISFLVGKQRQNNIFIWDKQIVVISQLINDDDNNRRTAAVFPSLFVLAPNDLLCLLFLSFLATTALLYPAVTNFRLQSTRRNISLLVFALLPLNGAKEF